MERVLISGSLALCISLGGLLMTGCTTDSDVSNLQQEVTTERTIETHGKYPWEVEPPSKIEEYVKSGEIVYLFSDGEILEEKVLSLTENDKKSHYADSWSKYLEQYIAQFESNYSESKAYFDKLKEVQEDLNNKNFEEIPKKIKEAKTLREE